MSDEKQSGHPGIPASVLPPVPSGGPGRDAAAVARDEEERAGESAAGGAAGEVAKTLAQVEIEIEWGGKTFHFPNATAALAAGFHLK